VDVEADAVGTVDEVEGEVATKAEAGAAAEEEVAEVGTETTIVTVDTTHHKGQMATVWDLQCNRHQLHNCNSIIRIDSQSQKSAKVY
jgi:hypothetical protein